MADPHQAVTTSCIVSVCVCQSPRYTCEGASVTPCPVHQLGVLADAPTPPPAREQGGSTHAHHAVQFGSRLRQPLLVRGVHTEDGAVHLGVVALPDLADVLTAAQVVDVQLARPVHQRLPATTRVVGKPLSAQKINSVIF